MTTATLQKTANRMYISGRGVIDTQAIKDNVGTSKYLVFTTDHGIGSISVHVDLVVDPKDGTNITFEGITSDGSAFSSSYDGDSCNGNLDILED